MPLSVWADPATSQPGRGEQGTKKRRDQEPRRHCYAIGDDQRGWSWNTISAMCLPMPPTIAARRLRNKKRIVHSQFNGIFPAQRRSGGKYTRVEGAWPARPDAVAAVCLGCVWPVSGGAGGLRARRWTGSCSPAGPGPCAPRTAASPPPTPSSAVVGCGSRSPGQPRGASSQGSVSG